MATDLASILPVSVVSNVISRQVAASSWLLQHFGMEPGGRNETSLGHGRNGAFDVFNNTRNVAQGRTPGAAAGTTVRQSVTTVPFTYPRMHESMSIPAELVHNLRQLGGSERDGGGLKFISQQTKYLGQKAANWRLAMLAGMLRDSMYVTASGDTWYPNFTTGQQISFGMPAGNKTQLDMLGGGSLITATWATASNNIPVMVADVKYGFEQLYGGAPAFAICGSTVWNHILKNDFVRQLAGTSSKPYDSLEIIYSTSLADGQKDPATRTVKYGARFDWCPELTWIVCDETINIGAPGSEAATPLIGRNEVLFTPDPTSSQIFGGYVGSEPIAEYDGGPKSVRTGFNAWARERANPTATELFVLDNFLPVNHVPNATAYATVVF